MLASIGAFLLSKLMSFSAGTVIEKALDFFNEKQDRQIRKDELDAETVKQAMSTWLSYESLKSKENETKFSIPWFWIIVGILMAPVAFYWAMLGFYNIFWHTNGIWPQEWDIAAYPSPYDEMFASAFNFIFAPAVGVGAIVSLIKGKGK